MPPGYDEESLLLGIKHFKQRRYRDALPVLERCAEDGALEAQRLLARMYYAGHGVPADQDRYLYWLTRAGENGDRGARAKLKRRYKEGQIPEHLLDDPFLRRLLGLES